MTDTLQQTITSTLLPPDPTIALKEENTQLRSQLYDLKYQLSKAKSDPDLTAAYRKVCEDLVETVRGDEWHDDYDVDALKARVHELVKDDDDDCWTPDRRFDITLTYTTTIQIAGYAKHEDEMRDYLNDNLPTLQFGPNYSTLEFESLDYDVDNIQID